MLKQIAVALFVALATTSCRANLLPNDTIRGESEEVRASPKDLLACVTAATRGVDGIAVDSSLYDARYPSVPLKTSMARVAGEVQVRKGGKLVVMLGIVSHRSQPKVQAYVAPRVKAIVAGIARECGND